MHPGMNNQGKIETLSKFANNILMNVYINLYLLGIFFLNKFFKVRRMTCASVKTY